MRLESLAIVVVALTSGMAPAQVCPTCPQPNGSPGRRIVLEEWQTPGQYAAPQWQGFAPQQYAAPQWQGFAPQQYAAPQWQGPPVLVLVSYGPPAQGIGPYYGRSAPSTVVNIGPQRRRVLRGFCPQ